MNITRYTVHGTRLMQGVLLLFVLCSLFSASPALALECLCASTGGDTATCDACVTFCGSDGRGGMTGWNGVGGNRCQAGVATFSPGGSAPADGAATCGCIDGSTPPATVTDLTTCCAACSPGAGPRAAGVQFNGVSRSCPAAAGAPGASADAPTPRTPGEFGYVNPLGTTSLNTVIARIIRAALGFVGALFLAMFIYAGVLWMTAGGDAKKIQSSKTTMLNAVVGLLVIALSYAIISIIFETAATIRG